jgi:FkbM family methyltransferase
MKLLNIKEHTFIDKGFEQNKPIIVDLGACLGEFTLAVSDLFGGIEKAILIEANPTNFNQIASITNSIKLNAFISSDSNGFQKFNEDPNSPYNGTSFFDYFEGAIQHEIKRISIDQILKDYNLKRIDILKIDIEGAEYDLLENLDINILERIDQITVEFHDFLDPMLKKRTDDLVQRIKSFGYSVISNKIDYKHGSEYYDTLFYR